eukprot:2233973-Amphidinium_carterae.1
MAGVTDQERTLSDCEFWANREVAVLWTDMVYECFLHLFKFVVYWLRLSYHWSSERRVLTYNYIIGQQDHHPRSTKLGCCCTWIKAQETIGSKTSCTRLLVKEPRTGVGSVQ